MRRREAERIAISNNRWTCIISLTRRTGESECSALASILSQNSDYSTLDCHIRSRNDDRIHSCIGWLQANFIAFAIKAFEGGVGTLDKGDDNVAVVGDLSFLDQNVIAVEDVLILHGLAAHLEHKNIFGAGEIGEK